jgi:hypothetical protein
MVLIDGDGMIVGSCVHQSQILTLTVPQFTDDFLQQGEAGGRRAASQLYAAVQAYIEDESKDIPINSRIVCRMYANVKGLADVLVRAGAIKDIDVFEDFARGFSRGKTLFDFVDVGPGKDRADEKIIGKSCLLQFVNSCSPQYAALFVPASFVTHHTFRT